MAKLPSDGGRGSGRGMSASAVPVASSTGVTAPGHTTYPTAPVGASEAPRIDGGLGVASSEHPDAATAGTDRASADSRRARPVRTPTIGRRVAMTATKLRDPEVAPARGPCPAGDAQGCSNTGAPSTSKAASST